MEVRASYDTTAERPFLLLKKEIELLIDASHSDKTIASARLALKSFHFLRGHIKIILIGGSFWEIILKSLQSHHR